MLSTGRFLTPVIIEDLGYENNGSGLLSWIKNLTQRRRWKLASEVTFYSAKLDKTITVPKDFVCDLSSVPRLPIVFLLFGEKAIGPSILHDWLYYAYELTGISRRESDIVFEEAMRTPKENYSKLTRLLKYIGVRVGGLRSWRKHRKEDNQNLRRTSKRNTHISNS